VEVGEAAQLGDGDHHPEASCRCMVDRASQMGLVSERKASGALALPRGLRCHDNSWCKEAILALEIGQAHNHAHGPPRQLEASGRKEGQQQQEAKASLAPLKAPSVTRAESAGLRDHKGLSPSE